MSIRTVLVASIFCAALPAQAVETTLQLQLSADQDFQRRTISYDCGTDTSLAVTYLDAAPNFLAIVPIESEAQPLVFAAIYPASGARYAASNWVWETRGTDASLFDATEGEDAEPILTCSEIINTP